MGMDGLEILSLRDGGWYDIVLAQTRVVEWHNRLVLRVRLRGFGSHDDEIFDYKEAMSDAFFRLSARVMDDGDIGKLVPSTRIAGLAQSRITKDTRWFDAVVEKVHKTTGRNRKVTLVTVKWMQREEALGFGVPKSNTLTVEDGQICILSNDSPSNHPCVVHWRKILHEVYKNKPKYEEKYMHRLKWIRMEKLTGPSARDTPAPALRHTAAQFGYQKGVGLRAKRMHGHKIREVDGIENDNDTNLGDLSMLASAASMLTTGRHNEVESSDAKRLDHTSNIEAKKPSKKRRHSEPCNNRKSPKVLRMHVNNSPFGQECRGGVATQLRDVQNPQTLPVGDFNVAVEYDKHSGQDFGGELVVGHGVVIEEVPNISEEAFDQIDQTGLMDEFRDSEPQTLPEPSLAVLDIQGKTEHQRQEAIEKETGGTRKLGVVPEGELAVKRFQVVEEGGAASVSSGESGGKASGSEEADFVAQGRLASSGSTTKAIPPVADPRNPLWVPTQAEMEWRKGFNIPGLSKYLGGESGLDASDGQLIEKAPVFGDFIPVPRLEGFDKSNRGAVDPDVLMVKEVLVDETDWSQSEGAALDEDQDYIITARRCPKVTLDLVGSRQGYVCGRDLRWKWNPKRNTCGALPPASLTTISIASGQPSSKRSEEDHLQVSEEPTNQSPSLDDWNQEQVHDATPPTPCSRPTDLELSFATHTQWTNLDTSFPFIKRTSPNGQ